MSGHLYAVLIGNGTFDQSQLRNLRCPARDVETLGEVLVSDRHGPYVVNKIVDSTHDVVRKEIYRRLKQAVSEDLVLIYYSGHGKLDDDGNLYLATRDTDVDALPPTSVSMLDVKKYAQDSSASKIVVILDCCFSGAVNKLYKGGVADQASEAMRSLEGQGTFYLTASTDVELAEEKESDEYSLLTKHLITGIRDGRADLNDDGRVSFQELCSFVQIEVPKEGRQRPRAWSLEASGDPTIALTGRPPYSGRKKAIAKKVYDLGNRDLLTEEDVTTLLKLIMAPQRGTADEEKQQSQKIVEQLYSQINNEGGFVREAILLANLASSLDIKEEPPSKQGELERLERQKQAQARAERARLKRERKEAEERDRAETARKAEEAERARQAAEAERARKEAEERERIEAQHNAERAERARQAAEAERARKDVEERALAPLPSLVREAIESPFPTARENIVGTLDVYLRGGNEELALAAREALRRLTKDETRRIADAARECINAFEAQKSEKLIKKKEEKEKAAARKTEEAKRARQEAEAERAQKEAEERERIEAQHNAERAERARQAIEVRARKETEKRERAEDESTSHPDRTEQNLRIVVGIVCVFVLLGIFVWLSSSTSDFSSHRAVEQKPIDSTFQPENKKASGAAQPETAKPPDTETPTESSRPSKSPATRATDESEPKSPHRARLSQGMSLGLLIRKIKPAYPPLARQARVQGDVVLDGVISKDGTVETLKVISGHPLLITAAMDAVKQWRYKPYLINGEPVEVETTITVIFELSSP